MITREDGTIERFLEKPGWGQVFSDTINTGIYVLEPEIFDRIPDGRSVDFSGEVFPAVLDAGLPLYGYVADGYWEDVGTTAAYLKAHEDILDGKVEVDVAGFELRPGIWIGKGSSIDPSVRIDSPAFVGENCTIDQDVVLGAYSTVGANTQVAAAGGAPALGHRRELLPRAGHEGGGRGAGALVRPPGRGPHRARCGRRRGLPGRGPCRGAQRRQGLPLQGRRGRRPGQRLHRVGIGRVTHPVRPRRRPGHRQRGRQPRAGGAPGQGVGIGLREGLVHHRLARHQPDRPRAQARPHGRVQLGRGQRQRPRAGHGAGDPAPRPHARQPGRPHRPPEPRRSAVGGDPLLRRARHRPLRERPAPGRAHVPPRGVPSGHGGRDRRHRLLAPHDRALHGRRRRGVRAAPRRRARGEAGPRPVLRRRQLRHAQPALEGGGGRAQHQPLRADAGHDLGRPRGERGQGRRRRARVGRRPGRGHRRRRRAADPDRRDRTRAVRRRGDHGVHRVVDAGRARPVGSRSR